MLMEISSLMPGIDEANSISEDLDKGVVFQLAFIPPEYQAIGHNLVEGKTKVSVQVRHLTHQQEWIWGKQEFFENLFAMRQIFDSETGEEEEEEEGEEGGTPDTAPLGDSNPFIGNPNSQEHVGTFSVSLESLVFLCDIKEQLTILDFKGRRVGNIDVHLRPVEPNADDVLVLNPEKDLNGKRATFELELLELTSTPERLKNITLEYENMDKEEVTVDCSVGTNLNHVYTIVIEQLTSEILKNLKEIPLTIQMWARQQATDATGGTTKQMIAEDRKNESTGIPGLRLMVGAMASKAKRGAEAARLAKRNTLLIDKVNDLKKLSQTAAKGGATCVPISVLDQLLRAGTVNASDKILGNSYDSNGNWLKDDFHNKERPLAHEPSKITPSEKELENSNTGDKKLNGGPVNPEDQVFTEKRRKSGSSSSSSSSNSKGSNQACAFCGQTGKTKNNRTCSTVCTIL